MREVVERMNVQELIDKLQKIEDKSLPVCIEDWNERYRNPAVLTEVEQWDSAYLVSGKGDVLGKYISLGAE